MVAEHLVRSAGAGCLCHSDILPHQSFHENQITFKYQEHEKDSTFIFSICSDLLSAQKPVELPLWPNGAPNNNGLKGEEVMSAPYRLTNVTQPTITVYRPATPNGMTIIMCPGGGLRGAGHEARGTRHGTMVQLTGHHLCSTEIPYAQRAP